MRVRYEEIKIDLLLNCLLQSLKYSLKERKYVSMLLFSFLPVRVCARDELLKWVSPTFGVLIQRNTVKDLVAGETGAMVADETFDCF